MALHLSGFLGNFLSDADNEPAASADSASFFPFDDVIGVADVSVSEALFAFSVAITLDRFKALKFQKVRHFYHYISTGALVGKATKDCRHA